MSLTDGPSPVAEELARERSLAQKTGWSAASSICLMVARLAAQVILARLLGAAGLGSYSYLLWLSEIVAVFTRMGLTTTLIRFGAELYGKGDDNGTRLLMRWVMTRLGVLTLVGTAVTGVLALRSEQNQGLAIVPVLLVAIFAAQQAREVNRAVLSSRQRFDQLAHINMVAAGLLLLGVTLGGALFGLAGALGGSLLGSLVPAVFGLKWVVGSRADGVLDVDLRQRLRVYAVNTWLAAIATNIVWARSEVFFLERFWDAKEVAMFTVSLTVASVASRAATLLSGAFMAHFSELVGQERHDLVQRQYATATGLMMLLVMPMSLGGAAIVPTALPLLVGPEYVPAIPTAMLLMASSGLAFTTIGSALIYARERSRWVVICGVLGTAIAVGAGFVVIPQSGSWGAACARTVNQLLMIALGTWYLTRRMGMRFPWASLLKSVVASTVCGALAWVLSSLAPGGVPGLVLGVVCGAGAYLVLLRLLGGLEPDEALQLGRLARRLPQRLADWGQGGLDWIGTTR